MTVRELTSRMWYHNPIIIVDDAIFLDQANVTLEKIKEKAFVAGNNSWLRSPVYDEWLDYEVVSFGTEENYIVIGINTGEEE